MITEFLINFAINLISFVGYPGIFFLSMLEGLLVPLPLEATLVFSGFLTSIGSLNLLSVILAGALGNLAGSTLAFLFFKHIGTKAISKLLNHYGKFLLISESELLSLNGFFKKHGKWIIILIRFIPGLRTILIIPVGLSKIDFKTFFAIYTVSSFLVASVLVYTGYRISTSWYQILPFIKKADLIILALIILSVAIYLKHKLKK